MKKEEQNQSLPTDLPSFPKYSKKSCFFGKIKIIKLRFLIIYKYFSYVQDYANTVIYSGRDSSPASSLYVPIVTREVPKVELKSMCPVLLS